MDSSTGPSTVCHEAPAGLPTTVAGVVRDILRHPSRHLLQQWNWKTALISLAVRGTLFFAVNATVSWDSAFHALTTELLFRAPMVGTLAAVTQSFRRVQPAWAAAALVMAVIPAIAHLVEFLMHWWRGTARLAESVAVSVGFSMVSTVTTYLLQRRGVLVVGSGGRPFLTDVLRAPQVLLELFAVKPARLAWQALSRLALGSRSHDDGR